MALSQTQAGNQRTRSCQ